MTRRKTIAAALALGLVAASSAAALDEMFDVTLEVVDDLSDIDVHVLVLEEAPLDTDGRPGADAAPPVSASAIP